MRGSSGSRMDALCGPGQRPRASTMVSFQDSSQYVTRHENLFEGPNKALRREQNQMKSIQIKFSLVERVLENFTTIRDT